MCEKQDDYYNMVERIEDVFSEMDSDICVGLLHTDNDYAEMKREISDLLQKFPVIEKLLEGEGPISLTTDEHAEFVRYLDLELGISNMERMKIYFRGHTDSFAYLKKIGAI